MITYPFTDAGLHDALKALGTTDKAVAQNLFEMGYRGIVGSESQDPPSRYVTDAIPSVKHVEVKLDVRLGVAYVLAYDAEGHEIAADLPGPVVTFVLLFDACKYPDLIEEVAHA